MEKNSKGNSKKIESAKDKKGKNNDDSFYNPNAKKMKYDPKTTKPTKPDFSQQMKQMEESKKKNLPVGLKIKGNDNKNTLADLSEKNPNFQVSYKGLNNYGNMCYSNVIMQCMVSIHEFVEMLNSIYDKVESEDYLFLNENGALADISFRYPALFNLVKTMNFYQIKNTSLASKHVKILTNYFDIRGEQNDAHEFLTFLFEKLNNEILDISKVLAEAEKKKKSENEIKDKIENLEINGETDKNKLEENQNPKEEHEEKLDHIQNTNNNLTNHNDLKDDKEIIIEKTENANNTKKNDLKSLLAESEKKKPKNTTTQKKPVKNAQRNDNAKKASEKNLINLDADNMKVPTSNRNNEINDGWEEVKKGGNRMKLGNTENSFDISMIGKIFQGILKHDLETKGLSISKCLIEPFFVLSLDLADLSLSNCFEKFFSRKKVENISNPAASFHQRAFIEKLPKILIIHVKGFYYDKVEHKVVKITKELEYPSDLKIKKDYFSPSVYHQYKDNEYELISIIIHKGAKASEGHYICFCKDSNNLWWALDDSKIFQVDENSFKHFRPYILFYRRID